MSTPFPFLKIPSVHESNRISKILFSRGLFDNPSFEIRNLGGETFLFENRLNIRIEYISDERVESFMDSFDLWFSWFGFRSENEVWLWRIGLVEVKRKRDFSFFLFCEALYVIWLFDYFNCNVSNEISCSSVNGKFNKYFICRFIFLLLSFFILNLIKKEK